MLPAELSHTGCVKENDSNGINYLRSSIAAIQATKKYDQKGKRDFGVKITQRKGRNTTSPYASML